MKAKLNQLLLLCSILLLAACVSEGEKFGLKWRADIDLDGTSEIARIAPRLKLPRIAPITMKTATPGQLAFLEPLLKTARGRGARNIYGTLISHPEFAEKFTPFAGYILRQSSLPARDRELLILRTGWLNRAQYEWEHHRTIALRAGISNEEIEAITEGPNAKVWQTFDAALLQAADELKADSFLSDETWATLKSRYTDNQMVDVIATVGNYTFISMFLNSLGVQLESPVQTQEEPGT